MDSGFFGAGAPVATELPSGVFSARTVASITCGTAWAGRYALAIAISSDTPNRTCSATKLTIGRNRFASRRHEASGTELIMKSSAQVGQPPIFSRSMLTSAAGLEPPLGANRVSINICSAPKSTVTNIAETSGCNADFNGATNAGNELESSSRPSANRKLGLAKRTTMSDSLLVAFHSVCEFLGRSTDDPSVSATSLIFATDPMAKRLTGSSPFPSK